MSLAVSSISHPAAATNAVVFSPLENFAYASCAGIGPNLATLNNLAAPV
jgi:hypothetical protein